MNQTLENAPETGRVNESHHHPLPGVLSFALGPLSEPACCADRLTKKKKTNHPEGLQSIGASRRNPNG